MAAFTSTQSGNWNDGATWGNSSPGTKGVDWPGNAGDTFTITNGHTVIYNVSEANELGASTINGILEFSTSMSTMLCFGNVILSIGTTGELRVGTSGTPIPAAYTAEILWNTTSDNSQGLTCANNGKYLFYGDPSYYTTQETTLANDAENTDGDEYIKTADDMSAVWAAGQQITIKVEKQGDSTSDEDAIKLATIVSISSAIIELDINITAESGVGSTWFSPVVNVSRNVMIGKVGASTAIADFNTLRPRIYDNNLQANNACVISNVQLTGIYTIVATGLTMDACVYRNSRYLFNISHCNTATNCTTYSCDTVLNTSGHVYTGSIYACAGGLGTRITKATFSGKIYSCDLFMSYVSDSIISGNIFSNNASSAIINCVFNCNFYLNNNTFAIFLYNEIRGKIGYDENDMSAPNSVDFTYSTYYRISYVYLYNTKLPLAGLVCSTLVNDITQKLRLCCEHYDGVLNAHKVIQTFGDVIKTPCDGSGTSPSVDPDGGNGDCVEVSNLQSNLGSIDAADIEIFHQNSYRIWAQASTSKTYTFKIQSIFTDTLQNTEISLKARYLDDTDGHTDTITSTGTIAARSGASDWTQSLSVTVNPAQTGWVDFQISLKKYESGKKIYVWPKVIIS